MSVASVVLTVCGSLRLVSRATVSRVLRCIEGCALCVVGCFVCCCWWCCSVGCVAVYTEPHAAPPPLARAGRDPHTAHRIPPIFVSSWRFGVSGISMEFRIDMRLSALVAGGKSCVRVWMFQACFWCFQFSKSVFGNVYGRLPSWRACRFCTNARTRFTLFYSFSCGLARPPVATPLLLNHRRSARDSCVDFIGNPIAPDD